MEKNSYDGADEKNRDKVFGGFYDGNDAYRGGAGATIGHLTTQTRLMKHHHHTMDILYLIKTAEPTPETIKYFCMVVMTTPPNKHNIFHGTLVVS